MISIEFESKTLDEFIASLEDPSYKFSPQIESSVNILRDDVESTTNVLTGSTKASWSGVSISQDFSEYRFSNSSITEGSNIPVVRILNDGRGEVRPVNKQYLYIPLSAKGRRKRLGEKIPDDFEYGVDYIFAKKARPFKGTQFISNAIDKFALYVMDRISQGFMK